MAVPGVLCVVPGIALALEGEGLSFTWCRSAKEAREALEKQNYDLLLFDISLPDGSGLELCRKVRQTSRVPIALLTAKDMELDIVKGLEGGADDYITKPFSLMVLRAGSGPCCAGQPEGRRKCIRILPSAFALAPWNFSKTARLWNWEGRNSGFCICWFSIRDSS